MSVRYCVLAAALLSAAGCDEGDPVMVDVNGATTELTITVEYLEVGREAGPAEALQLSVGEAALLSAIGVNALGLPLGDAAVTWSSSDPTVAEVDVDGTVTALTSGSASITADLGVVSATVPTTVTEPAEAP